MDMGHMHGNSTAEGEALCPMIMVFHGGHCEQILWSNLVASTYVEFIFSCLVIVVMGVLSEALTFLRGQLIKRAARKEAERNNLELQSKESYKSTTNSIGYGSHQALADIRVTPKKYIQNVMTTTHVITTLLFCIQVVLSYLLMLIFMLYNYWLCLSVVIGLGLGYFFFGWNQQNPDNNDCCH